MFRVFDNFYRVRSSETRMIVGSGLGLSIVKSIVESYGGELDVESTLGEGSAFTVTLPLGQPEVPAEAPS